MSVEPPGEPSLPQPSAPPAEEGETLKLQAEEPSVLCGPEPSAPSGCFEAEESFVPPVSFEANELTIPGTSFEAGSLEAEEPIVPHRSCKVEELIIATRPFKAEERGVSLKAEETIVVCETTPRMKISVGKLPAPFSLECVAVRGRSHDSLRQLPREALVLEASCTQAELRVGSTLQPEGFWTTLAGARAAQLCSAVAPVHFQVVLDETGLLLHDLSGATSNTTFVNGERVEGERGLQAGDVVTLAGPSEEAAFSFVVATFDGDAALVDAARDVVEQLSCMSEHSVARRLDAPMLEQLLCRRSSREHVALIENAVAPLLTQQCTQLLCCVS